MKLRKKYPVLDVRSPGEHQNGHVPGSFNMPLFDDQERQVVGSVYKNSGREAAILTGLGFVGKKLPDFVKFARKHAPHKQVLVHCWRGGMRSESIAWLLSTAGLDVFLLQGGYKAYRRYIREIWEREARLQVVSGKTGTGKTEIIHSLKQMGEQVIDLEGLAHHKGSAFGAIGELPQPTNEQFENILADAWLELDFDRPVWVEDESKYIGKVFVPDAVFNQKQKAKTFCVEIPQQARINRLIKDYASLPKDLLIDSIIKISRRLGGQHVKNAVEAIENNDFATAIEIVLFYYDKTYTYSLDQKDSSKVVFLECPGADAIENAKIVLDQSHIH